jgi:hypothetical protein
MPTLESILISVVVIIIPEQKPSKKRQAIIKIADVLDVQRQ